MGDNWVEIANPSASQSKMVTYCATGDMLLLTEDNNLYLRAGVTDENLTGDSWMLVDQVDATTVNCGYRGYFWIVRSNGVAAMRTGVTAKDPQGDGWQDFGPQTFLDIAVGDIGDCDIWAVGMDNKVYQRVETSDTNAAGTGWQEAATTLGDAFIKVSAGSAQVVAIDHHHNIWEKTAEDWVQVPGALRQASVGQHSIVWGVDESHDLWWRDGGAYTHTDEACMQTWTEVAAPAKMVQLDVGMNGGVYAVTNDNKLFVRAQAAGESHEDIQAFLDNTVWAEVTNLPAGAKDVAHCANGIVYYVDTAGQLIHSTNVLASNNFLGDGWATMATPEQPAIVTCGARGRMMFLSTAGNIFYRDGISYAEQTGTSFTQVDLSQGGHNSRVITVSMAEDSGDAWLLYEDGFVQYIDQTNAQADLSDDLGTGYQLVNVGNKQLTQIDAGNNEVWGVNHWHEVFKRVGITADTPGGTEWEEIPCEMSYVSTAEQGIVWAIDDNHDVWVLRTGSISTETEINNYPEWEKPTDPTSPDAYPDNVLDAYLTYVDVGRQGQLVGLKSSGCSFWMRDISVDQPKGSGLWYDLTNDQSDPATYYKFGTIAMC